MKPKEIDRLLHARSICREWGSAIRSARESVTIFSPFLDGLALSLLTKNSEIPLEAVKIITTLDSQSLTEWPNKLWSIKKLIRNGISVFELARLHTKVLLVDDNVVIFGSQNFTNYARESKEASAGPFESDRTRFLKTLQNWREQALPIDEGKVDQILESLRSRIKQHKQFREDSAAEFDAAVQQYEEEKRRNEELRRQRLEEIERQRRTEEQARQRLKARHIKLRKLEEESSIQMWHGEVYARIHWFPGGYPEYETLIPDAGYHMDKWRIRKPDGTFEPYPVRTKRMYPMIILDSLKMGFARICKGKMTYFRGAVSRTGPLGDIQDLEFGIEIRFPEENTTDCNIIITLTFNDKDLCKFGILFTGTPELSQDVTYPAGQDERIPMMLRDRVFSQHDWLDGIFRRYFTDFKFQTLHRKNHNIREYLDGSQYRLSMIEYMNNPFLVVQAIGR